MDEPELRLACLKAAIDWAKWVNKHWNGYAVLDVAQSFFEYARDGSVPKDEALKPLQEGE